MEPHASIPQLGIFVIQALFHWGAMGVSALAIFLIGFLWYYLLFKGPRMKLAGVNLEESKGFSIGGFVFALLSAIALSFMITLFSALVDFIYLVSQGPDFLIEQAPSTVRFFLLSVGVVGFSTLLYFVLGMFYSFMKKPALVALIDTGYLFLVLLVAASIHSFWPLVLNVQDFL